MHFHFMEKKFDFVVINSVTKVKVSVCHRYARKICMLNLKHDVQPGLVSALA